MERLERLVCRRVRRQLREVITARQGGPPRLGRFEKQPRSPAPAIDCDKALDGGTQEPSPSTSSGSQNNTARPPPLTASQKREAGDSPSSG